MNDSFYLLFYTRMQCFQNAIVKECAVYRILVVTVYYMCICLCVK
jgi:hypothetical protein